VDPSARNSGFAWRWIGAGGELKKKNERGREGTLFPTTISRVSSDPTHTPRVPTETYFSCVLSGAPRL
jgi:hypothetical protein